MNTKLCCLLLIGCILLILSIMTATFFHSYIFWEEVTNNGNSTSFVHNEYLSYQNLALVTRDSLAIKS